jgi:hypothetical protein
LCPPNPDSTDIERAILVLRGHRVILDKDLAALYGVTTGNLNKAVNRNLERFPDDFMLRLTEAEFNDLRFHFGRSRWGGTRMLPRAFTEQGVAMLSSVLRSPRAALVNIEIVRAFVRLREMIATNRDLARRLDELEKRSAGIAWRFAHGAWRCVMAARCLPFGYPVFHCQFSILHFSLPAASYPLTARRDVVADAATL